MKPWVFTMLPIVFWLSGCGEITSISLEDRPERALFPEVRSVLITAGCSGAGAGGGCHSVLTGNLQISIEDPGPADLDEEFLQIKAIVDLETPDESLLLQVGLPLEPISHQVCYHEIGQGCAYLKLRAWISGEPFPQCEVEVDSCFR